MSKQSQAVSLAEEYYDSPEADAFYLNVWGGEDIHVGCYEDTDDIGAAGVETVDRMAGLLSNPGPDSMVVDLGAGYGGSARRLASAHGCKVTCVNISETQNANNRAKNRQTGLDRQIHVIHGSFDDVPMPAESADVVWSQDAFLHAPDRRKVIEEAFRLLKPGGELVFTDPMQTDDVPDGVLQPVYDRLNLRDLGSMRFYREAAQDIGFEVLDQIDLVHNLRTHYDRVRQELESRRSELEQKSSADYLDKMVVGLRNWVEAADQGERDEGDGREGDRELGRRHRASDHDAEAGGDLALTTGTDARAHLADGPHLIGHRSDGAIGPTVRRCPWEQHRKQEDADATEAPRVICD